MIGPELGFTQPGMTIVCGDSHTSTHGAFGAIAFGIGTSEVEMVLATQCLMQTKPKQLRINIDGAFERRSAEQGHHSIYHIAYFGQRRYRIFCGICRVCNSRV